MRCSPIGVVRTPFETEAEAPRQGLHRDAEGRVEVAPTYRAGLAGLDPGRSLVVVWFADRADHGTLSLDRDGPRGVFTTRSQDRPNPVCLTECTVVGVDDGSVRVRGVDMVDGSPVLDLKPPVHPGRD